VVFSHPDHEYYFANIPDVAGLNALKLKFLIELAKPSVNPVYIMGMLPVHIDCLPAFRNAPRVSLLKMKLPHHADSGWTSTSAMVFGKYEIGTTFD
jgi:hypothetical protein